jgi:hypothetical protein
MRAWNRIRNNGDAISAVVVDRLFGGAPFHVPASEPHLLGVGSIMFLANRHSTVWGSGVLNRTVFLPPIASRQVRAVRGKLSADHMISSGITLGEVAFGDPAIFADVLARDLPLPAISTRRRVAVVPHHDSTQHPFFAGLRQRDDVCLVDMLDDSLKPIEDIARADIVLSQSLHGLVYAESLGIPSLWISHRSDEVWNFKFQDWFTTVDNPQAAPASMNRPLDELLGQAELRGSTIDRQALIETFPNELFRPTTNRTLGYRDCRALSPTLFFHPGAMDPTNDFLAERDMPVLAATSKVLRGLMDQLFKAWAERPYAIAAAIGAKAIPTPDQSALILRAMDQRAFVDQAFVINKPPTLPAGASAVELGQGVTLYRNLKCLGDVIYLRPSFETLTDNFMVFGL